jgi:probable metal-binding protein
MNEPKNFHGHDVMQMMLETGRPYSRAGLVAEIKARFGGDATFFTCSAEGLDAEGIVAFLEERGKFVAHGDGFQTSPEKICSHG